MSMASAYGASRDRQIRIRRPQWFFSRRLLLNNFCVSAFYSERVVKIVQYFQYASKRREMLSIFVDFEPSKRRDKVIQI